MGRALDVIARAVATGLGSGYSPVAPGTAGSLVGLLFYLPLAGAGATVQLIAITVLFFVGTAAATRTARLAGSKDPGIVVVDEVVGMWASLALLPFGLWIAVAGFFLFRLFDIWKPWPARQFEALPEGWGIMADDVMAGIYVNLVLRVGLRVWGAA